MSASAQEDSWSISVKAIGGAIKVNGASAESADVDAEKNFTVTVSPEDDLAALYDQIEDVTGIKPSQQRLIYRGRLIGGSPSSPPKNSESGSNVDDTDRELKIKDIAGLCDGQTIHLVRRQDSPESAQGESQGTSTNGTASLSGSATERDDSLSGTGTASLLAALIGLGGLDGEGSSEPSTTTAQRQRIGWRSSRLGRNRRPHYRLTSEDLEIPDPGSLEPVRQNLMTLHTLLPHAQVTPEGDQIPAPFVANRKWYVGQWIDVRDTVNQWLEATVVEILRPDDILPPRAGLKSSEEKSSEDSVSFISEPVADPAVSASDLDGRRQLLLEPCEEGDEDDEGGELAGFKRRASNKNARMLLVHYNGWPHRWDEWIRSDSERIRPFRTRTRHPTMSTHASPTPLSVFSEAPSTVIKDDDNAVEKQAMLSELNRAVSAVNELLTVAAVEHGAGVYSHRTNANDSETPWVVSKKSEVQEDAVDDHAPALSTGDKGAEKEHSSNVNSRAKHSKRQLELLAPLLDRLGRSLIDAAPHVAAMAASQPENEAEDIELPENSVSPDPVEENPSSLSGLLSLWGRDRRRQTNIVTAIDSSELQGQEHRFDPDYADFVSGAVNTTRGEVRTGPRSRPQNDDVAGLFGAYLAAASLGNISNSEGSDNGEENGNNIMGLGRLLRERGNNGGAGIDIHIHAVVTAPGVSPGGGGGLGFATLGSPTTTTTATRNILSPTRERRGSGSLLRLRTPLATEEDDMGLFSELYSENPAPVNPNSSREPNVDHVSDVEAVRSDSSAQSDGDFLARLSSPSSSSGISMVRTDSFSVSPSRSSSDGSYRRSSAGTSPRRSNVFGRLFRRSRRFNS